MQWAATRQVTGKAFEEWEKASADLLRCTNEAVLYADQRSYAQLRTMVTKWTEITAAHEASAKHAEAFSEVLRATVKELSKPLRKKLGLKEIDLKAP